MTFLEALKTGKPFKKPGYIYYIYPKHDALYWDDSQTLPVNFGPSIDDLSVTDLLDDDWEVKEETSMVTRKQAENALKIARDGVGNWNDDYYAFMTTLGFDPEDK